MTDDDLSVQLLSSARAVVARVRGACRDQVLWVPGVPRLHILARAAWLRQTESLEAAILLAEAARGYSAVPFVRPACEEYLWLKYLLTLDRSDAEQVLTHFEQEQVLDVLHAQEQFVGQTETDAVGLGGMRERYATARDNSASGRRELAKRLQWDPQAVARGKPPNMRFVAERVDELAFYKFLYGATSRHVHFNVAELMRRVWGANAVYRVGSESFSRFFTAFALSWLARILVQTVVVTEPLLPGTVARFEQKGAGDVDLDLVLGRIMPIVTIDELRGEQAGAEAG